MICVASLLPVVRNDPFRRTASSCRPEQPDYDATFFGRFMKHLRPALKTVMKMFFIYFDI